MSTVFNLDDDPIVIVVPSSADIPPGNITEAEWLALKDRVTVVEGYDLADLGDVDTVGEAGTALIKQEDGSFAFGTVSGAIDRIGNAGTEENSYGVRWISLRRGIAFAESSPGTVFLDVVYGGTGGSNSVARSDHTHAQPLPVRVTTAPSGYISGGSQPLGSTSVTLANGIAYVVEAELYGQFRGADSGPAYYTLSITIGSGTGATYTSPGGESGFWCVQGVPDKILWQYERRLSGTGAAVPVSASVAWHSVSGFNIDRTYLKVRVRPDR